MRRSGRGSLPESVDGVLEWQGSGYVLSGASEFRLPLC